MDNKPKTQFEIQCRKLEKTQLNDKEIHVIIQDPKPIETGFLQSNYVSYEVVTKELNWVVHRRFSDFEWLRNTLVKFHAGYVVAPLPNKKIGSRRFEVDFIEKRMKMLQKFMDVIMVNELFKASEPLNAFLSLTDSVEDLKKTLDEIGSHYGVSRERIRQIENRAISKLKKLCKNRNMTSNLKNYFGA